MKFRKKPVVIEAIQWLGPENASEVLRFARGKATYFTCHDFMAIETLEGSLHAYFGDWIIKGIKGEFYPCKPDIFEATYESVEETDSADDDQYEFYHGKQDGYDAEDQYRDYH